MLDIALAPTEQAPVSVEAEQASVSASAEQGVFTRRRRTFAKSRKRRGGQVSAARVALPRRTAQLLVKIYDLNHAAHGHATRRVSTVRRVRRRGQTTVFLRAKTPKIAEAMPTLLCRVGKRLVRIAFMARYVSPEKETFGKALRAARLAKRPPMTQDKLSELSGIPQPVISEIERRDDRANPTLDTMRKLAKGVGVPLSELLDLNQDL
jgi:hypothetical protein